MIVELIQHRDAVPLSKAGISRSYLVHGIFETGIVVDDLGRALALLRRRGVEFVFEPFADSALAYRTFAIRDNSGNVIQVFGK